MTEELIEIQSRVSSALHSRLGRRRSEGARGAEGKAVSRDHRSPSLDITERRMDSQSDPSQHSLESSETSRKANTKETSRSWKWSRVKPLISLRAIRALNARMFRGWKRLPRERYHPASPDKYYDAIRTREKDDSKLSVCDTRCQQANDLCQWKISEEVTRVVNFRAKLSK